MQGSAGIDAGPSLSRGDLTAEVRVALVTGGSRGIGRAVMERLAEEGFALAFTFREREEEAKTLHAQLEARGAPVRCFRHDAEKPDAPRRLAGQVLDAFGRVDVLVNNAATLEKRAFDAIDQELWDRTLAVNLRAPAFLSQQLLPGMMERGFGRVINLSSVGAQFGGTQAVHYAASKGALISLTRSLARMSAGSGVTVNAIAPGVIQTEIVDSLLDTEAGQRMLDSIPVGRLGTTSEIAELVAFLASEQSGYITGQTLNVNGGMLFG